MDPSSVGESDLLCFGLTCCSRSAESRNAEQSRVGLRAHRQTSLLLRRPDRALLPAPPASAAEPGRGLSRGQHEYPGPRPELRLHPGQRRGAADGHHPGGHQQRLSPGRGGPVGRFHNRRSLLVGYEILLRGSDRSEPAKPGPEAPQEAGLH